jgi:outer membrane protein TolC
MKYKLLTFLLLIAVFPAASAQSVLTLEEAVSKALKSNYDILLARTTADIDKVNNTAGNAGMLPGITANATDNYSKINLEQKLSNGTDIKKDNATNNALNSNVALSWTVFDGLKMFTTKQKLSQIEALGELQFKEQVLQTVYDVTIAYYNVVRQKQQLASLQEVINYNQERVKILQTSFAAGLTAKNNLLQSKIDLNVFTENALYQENVILAARRSLNNLLSQSPETMYEVSDTIPIADLPAKDTIMQKLLENNATVLAYRQQAEIARLAIKELNAVRYPKLVFNSSYNFGQTNASAGYQLFNRTVGPQIGGTFSVPLFQGMNNVRQVKVAKLQYDAAKYNLESIKLDVITQLENAISDFQSQRQLLDIEQDNDLLARENLEISLQRLKLGQTTELEVKLAQESFVESRTRLISFMYNVKVAEARLKQLMAEL